MLPLQTYATFLGLVAAGHLLRRKGILSEELVRQALLVLFFVFIPASVLTGAAGLERDVAFSLWRLGLVAVGQYIVFMGLTLATARGFGLTGVSRDTLVFLVAHHNGIFVPLPFIRSAAGEAGALAAVFYSQAYFLTFLILTPLFMDRDAFDPRTVYAQFWPLLAAMALAVTVVLAPGSPPDNLIRLAIPILSRIAAATGPLALFVVGASLRPDSSGIGMDRVTALTVGLRLVVGGILGVAVSRLVDLPLAWRTCIAVEFGSASATVNVILIERLGLDAEVGARAVFFTTMLSTLTIPIVLALV